MIRRALPRSLLLVLVCFTLGCPSSHRPRYARQHRGGCPKACAGGRSGPGVEQGTRRVERVIDGDTLVLNGGDRVRLAQVNAPEIDEEFGTEARDFARALVLDKLVGVEGSTRDGYGRLVADVTVGGKSLALELVARGLVHLYLIPPVDEARARQILAAQRVARQRRLGIWGTARYQGLFHITSFHANPPGNETFNLNSEYVRLASITDLPASLRGYALANRRDERYTFGDVVVPAGHTVIVASGGGTDQLDAKRQLKLFWNRTQGAWANKGDTASLRDPTGHVVDELAYDPRHRKQY
jgi:micrococcal nuclease